MKTVNLSREESAAPTSEHFPFSKPRQLQDAAVKLISDSWKSGCKYVFLEAPTGFGKSALAITLAREHPNAFILVSTKMLQDQYVNEKLYRAVDVRGRQNFRCIRSRKDTCDVGPCQAGAACRHQPERSAEELPADADVVARTSKGCIWFRRNSRMCSYWKQKCRAMNHRYPIFNYTYFLCESAYAGDFGKRSLIICDEAHNIEDELMKFIQHSVSDRDIEYLGSRIPEGDMAIPEWIGKLLEWRALMSDELENTNERLKNTGDGEEKTKTIKKCQELQEKIYKCQFIAGELQTDPKNWVIDNVLKGKIRKVTFKPIFVKRWANKFFGMADRFLLQSATIVDADALADSLGIPEDECIFIKAPSTFDPKRRPIYYKPIGSMSKSHIESNLPKLVEAIKALMAEYPGEKGVIHTHSYRIKEYVMANICSERLLANDDSSKRDRIIRQFIGSREPLVLVTPSAYEGVDFKHDICRWQVVCKMPYPDLADKQVRRRMELDRKWYQWRAVLRLVQTYGRGMRAEDDWCRTYILDESFSRLMQRNMDMFPEWFREAIVQAG